MPPAPRARASTLLARQHGVPLERARRGRRRSARASSWSARAPRARRRSAARASPTRWTSRWPICATPGSTACRAPWAGSRRRLGRRRAARAQEALSRCAASSASSLPARPGGRGRSPRSALFALQHRGQESAGVARQRRRAADALQGPGPDQRRSSTSGACRACAAHLAIAHCRYSTTGSTVWENAQPTFRLGPRPGRSRSATTATSSTPASCSAQLEGGRTRLPATTDTELLTALLADEPAARHRRGAGAGPADASGAPTAWSILDEQRVIGVRDPHGFRPLVLGRLPRHGADGRPVGRRHRRLGARLGDGRPRHRRRRVRARRRAGRDRRPRAGPASPVSVRFAEGHEQLCVFELIYFARPDSYMLGRNLYEARRRMGMQLAARAPGRGRPRHAGARHRARRPPPATPRRRASRIARAWSATATPAGRSSSRPRRCASAASTSS